MERGDGAALARMVPGDAPHQGLVLEVDALPPVHLGDLVATRRPVIVLDQVTDPHNVGAIIRSAAAFGAAGLVTQDRHSPPESGALAKAASGALERLPWARVTNLARALEEIAEAGYWRIGLAGEAERTLKRVPPRRHAPPASSWARRARASARTSPRHCDTLARLPISDAVESLNVSNAGGGRAICGYRGVTRPCSPRFQGERVLQQRPVPEGEGKPACSASRCSR